MKGISVFACEHLPQGFAKTELGCCSEENQIPSVICSVTLGKLLQRVPMFTYFTLKALAMLPLHTTPELHIILLFCPVITTWILMRNQKKRRKKKTLNSHRAYSSVHHRYSWCRVEQNENCANSHNSPQVLSSIQKKVKRLKSIIAEERSKICIKWVCTTRKLDTEGWSKQGAPDTCISSPSKLE